MIEVELKYRLDDPEALVADLIARGASPRAENVERDIYFNHPARDFRQTQEALRLRWDGSDAVFTYKGPLLDQVSKSREELELDLPGEAGLERLRLILSRLGFQEAGDVEKRRRKFPLVDRGLQVLVTIDEVTGLGLFVELEAQSEGAEFEPVRDALMELAGSLGLGTSERRSYLELIQGD